MTEPSQDLIDRAREIGLSFDPTTTSDDELRSAIATYERVYIEAMAQKAAADTEKAQRASEHRKTLGWWSPLDDVEDAKIDDVRNPG